MSKKLATELRLVIGFAIGFGVSQFGLFDYIVGVFS